MAPAVGEMSEIPMRRPAASAVVMTALAPDWRSTGACWDSRTAATTEACGARRRMLSVIRTALSSESVATIARAACDTAARSRTSSRRASPTIPTQPMSVASLIALSSGEITTI